MERNLMVGFCHQNSRLPLNHGGGGVSFGLAGEQHIGSTHVPVVVVAYDRHLRGIWRGKQRKDGGKKKIMKLVT